MQAEARQVQPSAIGGLAIGSDWVTPTLDKAGLHPFPSFPPDARYPSGDWITHLEAYHSAGNHTTLTPTDPNFNITEALWDRRERKGVRQVHEAVISTFWGQTRALKEAIRNGDESALIMEDDVDVEWDIERLWSRIETKLPEGWDVTFLGHCWGHEILSASNLFHLHLRCRPRAELTNPFPVEQHPGTATLSCTSPSRQCASTAGPSPPPAPAESSPRSSPPGRHSPPQSIPPCPP